MAIQIIPSTLWKVHRIFFQNRMKFTKIRAKLATQVIVTTQGKVKYFQISEECTDILAIFFCNVN